MNNTYEANAIVQSWHGAVIDHVGVEQSECSVQIYLTNGKFISFQPRLNLWLRGINMVLGRVNGEWGGPKSKHEIVQGAAGAYCRKHGDNGTLESAFKAGVEWSQHQAVD